MDFLQELNDSQRQAVEYIDGASLVIAGAGSGKTRVLTYKIAYLLLNGYKPWNILALTFTNKAAREMKQRVETLLGDRSARYIQMGTFHSIFARILRAEAPSIGFNNNFTIYDETDSRSLIKNIIKEMNLDDKVYKPASVHNIISMAKNHLISAEQYAIDAAAQRRDQEHKMPAMTAIYSAYSARCKTANAMDFDDLLMLTFQLFNEHDDIRRKYAERFQYVLVDEYQDTNYAQQCIVLQLTREHQHVCVVGDDAQSIYAFRGANIDNILNFQKIYNDTRLFKLEQNYRSTQRIVQAANSLIKHNQWQIQKDVFSRNDQGEKIIYRPTVSDKEEALLVCRDIKRIMKAEHCEYSDFAILYRTNAQSRTFEEQMRSMNIPYRIYGGLSFYQRKEIKDIIAYLRLVANPDDEEALRRIINYPARGIGNTTLNKVLDTAHQADVSVWALLENPLQYGLQLKGAASGKLAEFRNMIAGFINRSKECDVAALADEVVRQSGVSKEIFSDTSIEGMARQENVRELMNAINDFVDTRNEEDRAGETGLNDYLQEVSLITDLDSDGDEEAARVTLMTIHSAKGLEFPTVFIVGLDENIFPSQLCTSARELEEERRLFYVAITRAEKHCILTSAENRYRYGKPEFCTPSRFIREIDPALMTIVNKNAEDDSWAKPRRQSRLSRMWEEESRSYPVATQFKADPRPSFKPSINSSTGQQPPRPSSQPTSQPSTPSSRIPSRNLRSIHSLPSGKAGEGAPISVAEGSVISHDRFGIGDVLRVEGTGENTKITVNFQNVGVKQLLIKFARFQVIK